MFVLHTHTGRQIQLEWGTYAMHVFCEKRGVDLRGFVDQISSLQFNIPSMVAFIQSAVIAAKGQEPSFEECCDWIDECGGLLAQTGPLQDFANYIIEKTVLKTSDPETIEKKSPSAY